MASLELRAVAFVFSHILLSLTPSFVSVSGMAQGLPSRRPRTAIASLRREAYLSPRGLQQVQRQVSVVRAQLTGIRRETGVGLIFFFWGRARHYSQKELPGFVSHLKEDTSRLSPFSAPLANLLELQRPATAGSVSRRSTAWDTSAMAAGPVASRSMILADSTATVATPPRVASSSQRASGLLPSPRARIPEASLPASQAGEASNILSAAASAFAASAPTAHSTGLAPTSAPDHPAAAASPVNFARAVPNNNGAPAVLSAGGGLASRETVTPPHALAAATAIPAPPRVGHELSRSRSMQEVPMSSSSSLNSAPLAAQQVHTALPGNAMALPVAPPAAGGLPPTSSGLNFVPGARRIVSFASPVNQSVASSASETSPQRSSLDRHRPPPLFPVAAPAAGAAGLLPRTQSSGSPGRRTPSSMVHRHSMPLMGVATPTSGIRTAEQIIAMAGHRSDIDLM